MSCLFCCYSKELKNFLSILGFRYEVCGLNPNSNSMFWAYMRSEELHEALRRWKERGENYLQEE